MTQWDTQHERTSPMVTYCCDCAIATTKWNLTLRLANALSLSGFRTDNRTQQCFWCINSYPQMPSNSCLHLCTRCTSITKDKIQHTHCVCDVHCGVITPLCFIQCSINGIGSSSVLQVSGRGEHQHGQRKRWYTFMSGLRCHLSLAILWFTHVHYW